MTFRKGTVEIEKLFRKLLLQELRECYASDIVWRSVPYDRKEQ